MGKEIIQVNGRWFHVLRKFKENRINLDKGSVKDLKTFFYCDSLFKAKGLLWICNEIHEVEYEEIEN